MIMAWTRTTAMQCTRCGLRQPLQTPTDTLMASAAHPPNVNDGQAPLLITLLRPVVQLSTDVPLVVLFVLLDVAAALLLRKMAAAHQAQTQAQTPFVLSPDAVALLYGRPRALCMRRTMCRAQPQCMHRICFARSAGICSTRTMWPHVSARRQRCSPTCSACLACTTARTVRGHACTRAGVST